MLKIFVAAVCLVSTGAFAQDQTAAWDPAKTAEILAIAKAEREQMNELGRKPEMTMQGARSASPFCAFSNTVRYRM